MSDVCWAQTPEEAPAAAPALTAGEDELERLSSHVRAAFADPTLTREQALRLAELAETAAQSIRRRRDAAAITRLRTELGAQAALARRFASTLLQSRDTFQAALSSARAGVWECRLPDERLTWTSSVYELFGAPNGARLHRNDMLGCYSRASLRALEDARSRALQTGGGFRLDAEIETLKGVRRWIRLTGLVEIHGGVPIRLYGMKQDVTEEKAHADHARLLSEVDALTGLSNRRLFEDTIAELADHPKSALLLVDLDGFKQINDTFGHVVGDEFLKTVASRLKLACRGAALVARIGGDEFAVLYAGTLDRYEIERRAQGVVDALRIPAKRGDFELEFGASVGAASAEGSPPRDWIARADMALYAAKAAGRATFRMFHPAMARVVANEMGFGAAQERISA